MSVKTVCYKWCAYLSALPDFPWPSRDYSQLPGNSRSPWKLQGYKTSPWKLPDSQDFLNFAFLLICTAWVLLYSIEPQDILHHIADFIMFITSLYVSGWLSSGVQACHWTSWQRHSYLFRLHCINLPMHLFCTSIEIFPLRMGLWIFLTPQNKEGILPVATLSIALICFQQI